MYAIPPQCARGRVAAWVAAPTIFDSSRVLQTLDDGWELTERDPFERERVTEPPARDRRPPWRPARSTVVAFAVAMAAVWLSLGSQLLHRVPAAVVVAAPATATPSALGEPGVTGGLAATAAPAAASPAAPPAPSPTPVATPATTPAPTPWPSASVVVVHSSPSPSIAPATPAPTASSRPSATAAPGPSPPPPH
jgi:hypothetical protein